MSLAWLALLVASEPPAELQKAADLAAAPAVSSHRSEYEVESAIRLGFFWWSRKRAGSASRRFGTTGSGCRFIELAAGSDPKTAPLKLKRWGAMKEVHDPLVGSGG